MKNRFPQNFRRSTLAGALFVLLLGFSPVAADAQGTSFALGLMGGFGGSPDSDINSDIDNLGLQLLFSMKSDLRTRLVVRLGQLDLEGGDLGSFFDRELTYATFAAEYGFNENFYESGLFLGLGAYSLDRGSLADDETAIGLTGGVTGDFHINRRWSVLVELAAHYADFDDSKSFVTGMAGILYHF